MDQQFGNLAGRHLHLRWLVPFAFEAWDGSTWRFSWWKLLNPRRWLSAARGCGAWRAGLRRFKDRSGRCYCPDGNSVDAELVLFGFGVLVWYSHFTGKTPCICDCVMAEHFGCRDCGALPVVKDSTLCAECTAEVAAS